MRLMFVYFPFKDQGSGLVIQGYTEAAKALGHEVAVYGRNHLGIPLNYSMDIESADAAIFIFEWTTQLAKGDALDLARLLGKVPRARRVILDGDGNYNDPITVAGDYNHRGTAAARRWIEICDSLCDKICQPTYHPLKRNVRPFLFYAFNPSWVRPLDFATKKYSMIYVGHCKFRWLPMLRVLQGIEPIRERVGRIAMVGEGWAALPPWARPMHIEDYYFSDPSYLKRWNIETLPAVPFPQVIDWMGKAVFNPVIARPTFGEMRLVTPRLFETLAASTLPLFGLDAVHVQEIYGDRALELMLPHTNPDDMILDLITRPEHFAGIVRSIRQHLSEKHSHTARLKELFAIVQS